MKPAVKAAVEELRVNLPGHIVRTKPDGRIDRRLHPGRGNYVVHDAQMKFGLDKDSARHEKISMFGHGPCQCVLNRDDGRRNCATLHAVENLRRPCAGNDRAPRQHALCRFVTERPEFALDRNFHGGFQQTGKVAGVGEKAQTVFEAALSPPATQIRFLTSTSASTPFE